MNHPEQQPPAGLIASLSALLKSCIRLLLSRLELAALELGEVRQHLMQLALVFALALVAFWFAIAFGTAAVIYLAWQSMGWTILPVLAVLFVLAALGLLWYGQRMVKQGKLGLPATMAELKADRDMLL